MLSINNTALVLVDVQGKLADLMHERQILFENLAKLVRGMQVLRIPVIWLEQNPDRMDPTIPAISALLQDNQPIAKMSFSCCGAQLFLERLQATQRNQLLLAGIEAHVCVYQTALDLLARGYEVEVVVDAVSSRMLANKLVALEKMRSAGARLTSVEMALFELLRTAEHPAFREILKIVK